MMKIQTNDEQLVAQTVRKQVSAMVDSDIDELNKIIAPAAIFGHITGATQTKAEWLKQIEIGRMHYFGNHEVLLQVSVDDDSAEVISRNELDARIYGFRNTWPLQSKTELKKINGQWLITKSKASMY